MTNKILPKPSDKDFLRSFGRRKGRLLPDYKQKLVDELLPTLSAPTQFDQNKKYWLEIGFGAGEHLFHMAQHHPQNYYIGAEPYQNGVAKLLRKLDAKPCSNLSIICDDVRPYLQQMPESTLDGIYLLFPDPWPKRNHHKRRIVNHVMLNLLHNVLKPRSKLFIATDHVDYSAWIMEHLLSRDDFKWTAKTCDDWQKPFTDWTETRYQQKTTNAGRLPIFLEFERL